MRASSRSSSTVHVAAFYNENCSGAAASQITYRTGVCEPQSHDFYASSWVTIGTGGVVDWKVYGQPNCTGTAYTKLGDAFGAYVLH